MYKDNQITLYHGTNSKSMENILKDNQIICNNTGKGNNLLGKTSTKQNGIYLTKYKETAMEYTSRYNDNPVTPIDNELILPIVIRLNVDTNTLGPDEDFLTITSSNFPLIGKYEEIYNKYFDRIKDISINSEYNYMITEWKTILYYDKELAMKMLNEMPWTESIEDFGNVITYSNIPISNIEYIDIFYTLKEYIRITDITLENYKKCFDIALNKYNEYYDNKYKEESKYLGNFKNPIMSITVPNKYNKLINTIYENLSIDEIFKLNDACRELNYGTFDNLFITKTQTLSIQTETLENIEDFELSDMDEYFKLPHIMTEIRSYNNGKYGYKINVDDISNLSFLLDCKDSIDNIINNEKIITIKIRQDSRNYYDIAPNEFWDFVNKH